LYITPEEEKKAKAEEKRARQKKRKAKGLEAEEGETADVQAESGKVVDKGAPRTTSFGCGRGTLFLLERRSPGALLLRSPRHVDIGEAAKSDWTRPARIG
jgi:hypothetical protein